MSPVCQHRWDELGRGHSPTWLLCDFLPSLCLAQSAKNPENWEVTFSPVRRCWEKRLKAHPMSVRFPAWRWRVLGGASSCERLGSDVPTSASSEDGGKVPELPELQKCLWATRNSQEKRVMEI